MSTPTCASCGKEVESDDNLFLSEDGKICGECQVDLETSSTFSLTNPMTIIGGIAGVFPFFLNYVETRGTQTTTKIGGKTITTTGESFYMNYTAVAGGAVAAVVGIILSIQALRADDNLQSRWGIAATVIGLSAIQLLRGFGIM